MNKTNCHQGRLLVGGGLLVPFVLSTCLTACGGSGSGDPTEARGPSSGAFVYVTAAATSGGPGAILQYAIGPDGSPTPMTVSSVPAGADPTAITADPAGKYVYAVNGGDRTISQYSVGAEGRLTPLSPAVVSVSMSPWQGEGFWASIDPSGRYLYLVTSYLPRPPGSPASSLVGPASIAQYSIGSGGQLTPLTPAFVTLSTQASGPLVIDSIGRHAYVGGGLSGVVLQFSLGSDGTLSPLALAGVAADNPTGLVLTPRDDAAYVLGRCVDTACYGEVTRYWIQPDGSLNPRVSSTPVGGHIVPVEMVLNSSGSNAYLLTNFMGVDTNSGKLYPFTIDGAGALVAHDEVDTGSAAVAEVLNAGHLYILTSDAQAGPLNVSGGQLVHFALASGGTPSKIASTRIDVGYPTAMAIVVAP